MKPSKAAYQRKKAELLDRARFLEWTDSKWADMVLALQAENLRLQAVISKKSYDYGEMVEAARNGQTDKIQRLVALHGERTNDARYV